MTGFIACTDRVLLRQLAPADVDPLCRVFGDPEVMRFSFGVQTRDWVVAWLGRCAEEYGRYRYGPWAVEELTRREVIGYCGPSHLPSVNGRTEVGLGYRLVRSAWGRGYATEAAQLTCEHAFRTLGLPRLIALIDPANTASIRVAEKIGMVHVGSVLLEGYNYPDRMYVVERATV